MSEQIDIAVDLGVVPPPLPEIMNLRQLVEVAPPAPPQIIEGILHQGCKMVLGGYQQEQQVVVPAGFGDECSQRSGMVGRRCTKMPVVYINFELHRWSIGLRINALCGARPECSGLGESLALWNLRGRNGDLTLLRPKLEEQLARHQFGLIILDPAYKLLGDRDENANGEIAGLMNEFEALAQSSGAAVVVAHHFAKGTAVVNLPWTG
jgi:RecA-family ATPase